MQSREPNKEAVTKLLLEMNSNFARYLERQNIANFITENGLEINKSKTPQENMANLQKAFADNGYSYDAEYLTALIELHKYLDGLIKKNEEEIRKEKATYKHIEEVYNALQQTQERLIVFRNKYNCDASDLSNAAEDLFQACTKLYGIVAKRNNGQIALDVLGTTGAAIAGFIIGAIIAATVIIPIAMIIWDLYHGQLSCGDFFMALFAPITFPLSGACFGGQVAHNNIKGKQMAKNIDKANPSTLFKPALSVSNSILDEENNEKFAKTPGVKQTNI